MKKPQGLAIDWVSDNIYWTDAETHRVEMTNLDGTKQKTIAETNLDKPHAIAVDPESK